MPKSRVTKRYKKRNFLSKRKRGGMAFPTVDNVIPYNSNLGTSGDPRDPGNIIDSRGLPNFKIGGRRKRSKRRKSNKRMNGGGIFNYDLLTGETYNNNAVQSINSSSGTQNTAYKLSGLPQEMGPNLGYKSMPDTALV